MVPKHLYLLILAVVACAAAQSQDDELNIPDENDNQFPPENYSESSGIIEGSGVGAIEEPIVITTTEASVILEDVQLTNAADNEQIASEPEDTSCPKPCVCHTEGYSGDFFVDCSGYGLTEFPSPIDIKTTTLNIQNNKLTEIPREVSQLKSLKVLNANDNEIMDLASGSISELPELTVLKLGNNRLLDFPKDLKNSFGLTKLEELDLGGNDMRTPLTGETFTSFIALRNLTLPMATTELLEDLCSALKGSLELVCSESCSIQVFECPDAPQLPDKDDLSVPANIAFSSAIEDDNIDMSAFENSNTNLNGLENIPAKGDELEKPFDDNATTSSMIPSETATETTEFSLRAAVDKAELEDIPSQLTSVESPKTSEDDLLSIVLPATIALSGAIDGDIVDNSIFENTNSNSDNMETTIVKEKPIDDVETASPANADPSEFAFRSAINKPESVGISPLSTIVEAPKANEDDNKETDVAVGATTLSTKTGGVDKSVIGVIVAGMVLVVAGITIKKNWSSIKNKFNSSPRPANDRTPHTNGSAPEEVPLQDNKSPV